MELKPIFRRRSDEAGLELPRDYFLAVGVEILDSRFGHSDRPVAPPDQGEVGVRRLNPVVIDLAGFAALG